MAHPILHSKSSAKQFGGKPEDYLHIHNWFDETKSWIGTSFHRVFRHHSEGIFECEKTFGESFLNSDVKEDCNNYIPSAKEWVDALNSKEKPLWMMKTMKLKFTD